MAHLSIKKDHTISLIKPRITEKASIISQHNVYTFDISADANKHSITQAIKELYKVTPVDVRILRVPSKQVMSRGKVGTKSGGRKAYVQLKKGDVIDFA